MLELRLFAKPHISLVRQVEPAECGLACLTMIAGFHGLKVDIAVLRRRFTQSTRGSTLRNLMNTADQLGLAPRAVSLSADAMQGLSLPCILHWNTNHYVVLERLSGERAYIHDPVGRSGWVSMVDVRRQFTGYALELRPSEDFQRGRVANKLKLSHLWHNVPGIRQAIAQSILLGFLLEFFVLASPYYMQVAIDNAIPALDSNLMLILALGFGLLALFNVMALSMRMLVIMVAGNTFGYSITNSVVRHMFRLPVDWFEKRHVGDILSRFGSVAPIQRTLTEGATAALIDGILAIFTLIVMFIYSSRLAIVSLVAFGLYGLIRWLTFTYQRAAHEGGIVAHSVEQSMMIESVRGILTLRLLNQETLRHSRWQNAYTDAINADMRLSRISIWQTTASALVSALDNIVTIWLAVNLIIDGSGFSVGMLFAYIAYRGQFMQKATSLIDQGINLRVLGLHLERLSDIVLSIEDKSFTTAASLQTALKGKIELRNVSYRYGPEQPLILKGINLVVNPGEHIAITGPSGGGKSTLVKIMLGLVEPDDGSVLIDDIPFDMFGLRSFRDQVSAVLQNDSLFAGTLQDNIGLSDERPDYQRVVAAARLAAIHDDIEKMPLQYDTLLGDMGSSLSGGQKQRVLLARALYRKPKMLIMDEGTAHLDAALERAVNTAVSSMGITRIIIAHRRETIEAADQVWKMTDGVLHLRMPGETWDATPAEVS
jgi:ATP-binding cassette subfamily B protein RaxB